MFMLLFEKNNMLFESATERKKNEISKIQTKNLLVPAVYLKLAHYYVLNYNWQSKSSVNLASSYYYSTDLRSQNKLVNFSMIPNLS